MGVLNVTPDSFSDGGRFVSHDAAIARAEHLLACGADLIDVGGESTRPGAAPVTTDEELERVLPVVMELLRRGVLVSIDTSKPAVMQACIAAGVHMVNDVYALRAAGAVETVAASQVAVCLMHMQGEPRTMQREPRYADVVAEVREFLGGRVAACRQAGIEPSRMLIDPGFGFGKTLDHNLALLRDLARVDVGGLPMLVGLS
ncbi:MAG: dihydropteroate synthase, partial [Gammaproteobacteria bacterium]|nr:dihydropteroate synthase [Gammaproteobacteria bacterium]